MALCDPWGFQGHGMLAKSRSRCWTKRIELKHTSCRSAGPIVCNLGWVFGPRWWSKGPFSKAGCLAGKTCCSPAPRRRWLSSHRDTCTSYMLSQYSRSSSGISLSEPTWVAWIGPPSRERRGPAAFCRKFGGDVSLRRAFAKMVRWRTASTRTSWRAWLC